MKFLSAVCILAAGTILYAGTYQGKNYSAKYGPDGRIESVVCHGNKLFKENVALSFQQKDANGKWKTVNVYLMEDYRNKAAVRKDNDSLILSKSGTLIPKGAEDPVVRFEFSRTFSPDKIKCEYKFTQLQDIYIRDTPCASQFRTELKELKDVKLTVKQEEVRKDIQIPEKCAGKKAYLLAGNVEELVFTLQNGSAAFVYDQALISIMDARAWGKEYIQFSLAPLAGKSSGKPVLSAKDTVWSWSCEIIVK